MVPLNWAKAVRLKSIMLSLEYLMGTDLIQPCNFINNFSHIFGIAVTGACS